MNFIRFVDTFCVIGVIVIAFSPASLSDEVIFPNELLRSNSPNRIKTGKTVCSSSKCGAHKNPIPISLAKQLSYVSSEEQFLRQFVENGPELVASTPTYIRGGHPDFGISFRSSFVGAGVASNKPIPGNCKPELRVINLRDTNDPTVIYYPTCIRLEQCGGCCNHELLQCEFTKTSPVNVTIQVTQYTGNKTLKYLGPKNVTLTKHDQCQCDCKTKAADCRGRQVYKSDECRCVCPNDKEQMECAKQSHKLWNPTSCECECRTQLECSSGSYLDMKTCTCKKIGIVNYDNFFYRLRP